MSPEGSVTHWLAELRGGNPEAVQPLWEHYFQRLVGLARTRLQGIPRRAADEEDVALSAFDSFCHAVDLGRFPRLNDRNDLWQVLVMITVRKASDLANHERRDKRGGGRVLDEQAAEMGPPGAGATMFERLVSRDPTPEFAAQVADECRRLLGELRDDTLRDVARWKMEGLTDDEVAEKLGCVTRTVRRKVEMIRSLWSKEIEP